MEPPSIWEEGRMRTRQWTMWLWVGLAAFAFARSNAEDESQSKNPPPAAQQESPPPPSVTIIPSKDAYGVLGRDVRSPTNEDMGRIVDVIVDRTGTVRAAVIDFGGFLGVGSRKIVVEWNALHFGKVAHNGEAITLDLSKAQVAAAPEYKEDKPIVVLGAAGNLEPLEDH